MSKLSKNVLQKIKKENIKPVSKYVFVLTNFALWIVFTITVILGAFSFGMILLETFNLDWDVIDLMPRKFWVFNMIIPYLWVSSVILLVTVSYFIYRKTTKGYKKSLSIIVVSSLILSVLIGTAFYKFRLSERFDNFVEKKAPEYHNIISSRNRVWVSPEQGFLGGKVIEVRKFDFDLLDPKRNKWKVIITPETILWVPEIIEERRVKIHGNFIEKGEFEAIQIKPWSGLEKFRKNLKEIRNSSRSN